MGVMLNFSSWEWPFLITIIPMWLFNQFVITTILTWCCEHENKIKHKYLVDKKPRYQLRPHKTAPRLTCDLCEWLAMEPTLLRPNIRPCCEFIRSPMVAQHLRLFLTVKNTRKTFPTSGESESVRVHFWDNGGGEQGSTTWSVIGLKFSTWIVIYIFFSAWNVIGGTSVKRDR